MAHNDARIDVLLRDLSRLERELARLNKSRFPNVARRLRERIRALRQEVAVLQAEAEVEEVEKEETEPGGGTPTTGTGSVPPEPVPTGPVPPIPPASPVLDPHRDTRELFRQFLRDWDLPESLMVFINEALTQNMSQQEVLSRLYLTPEYLAVYPEGETRRAAGLTWWAPAQIRQYREEVRRLVRNYLGIENLSNQEIAGLITKDVGLPEWEQRLNTWTQFQRWGPTVRAVLEAELGFRIPDDRVFAFMSPDIPTAELDRAYEKALLRGQPALLGLGVRPEDEAELLRRFGISPEQAFRGYQNIVAELPAQERFDLIEREIGRGVERFPTGTELFAETPFALLFRGVQLGDAEAMTELRARMARETARWQAGGGTVRGGLATREERTNL